MKTHFIKQSFGTGPIFTRVTIRYADANSKDGTRAAIVTVKRCGKRSTETIRQRCRLHVTPGGCFIRENGPKRKCYRPGVMIYKGIAPVYQVFLDGNNFDGVQVSIDAITVDSYSLNSNRQA